MSREFENRARKNGKNRSHFSCLFSELDVVDQYFRYRWNNKKLFKESRSKFKIFNFAVKF